MSAAMSTVRITDTDLTDTKDKTESGAVASIATTDTKTPQQVKNTHADADAAKGATQLVNEVVDALKYEPINGVMSVGEFAVSYLYKEPWTRLKVGQVLDEIKPYEMGATPLTHLLLKAVVSEVEAPDISNPKYASQKVTIDFGCDKYAVVNITNRQTRMMLGL